MNASEMREAQMKEPLAELEKELINAYVTGAGQDFQTLLARADEEARRLLSDASLYATARLTEIESRSHYLRSLRGEP